MDSGETTTRAESDELLEYARSSGATILTIMIPEREDERVSRGEASLA